MMQKNWGVYDLLLINSQFPTISVMWGDEEDHPEDIQVSLCFPLCTRGMWLNSKLIYMKAERKQQK